MNTLKRLKLQQQTDNIVKDLDTHFVITPLLSRGVLNGEDVEMINSEKTRKARARHLLDVISRKGEKAFDEFLNCLKPDYPWLYEAFINSNYGTDGMSETDSVEEINFYDVFLLGGVPHPPPYNVKRYKKLADIRSHLKSLERGHYVVLHGMTGSGKSCLAAASVEDRDILMKTLKGCVYWITAGDSANDDIVSYMIGLLDRLEMDRVIPPQDGSVILDKAKAKERLKRFFLTDALRNGLLILDDVRSAEFIEWFDFGCKIMVTTKDLDVMTSVKGRYDVVQVNASLSEEESLSLLANSVHLTLDKLPEEAKLIHSLCLGYPMTLALIAGQLEDNKEDARISRGRWKHYVNMLKDKNLGHNRRNSFLQNECLLKTISFSVDALSPILKGYYHDFAVFMEDVNIKPEVLQTLWSFSTKYEVEDTMSIFTKKSLAVKKWNKHFQCNIYGIHDLLLDYLKRQLEPEGKIDLHKKLLRRYEAVCGGKYAELPDDNYIFSYIGYHLNEAREWTMFKNVFLDLPFLQSKVRIAGPADLLRDFKKYEKQIVNGNEELKVKLDDYVLFIQECGVDLYKCHELDIIQCGLQQKKTSHVYHDAYKFAREKPEKLYLEFLTDQDFGSQPPFHIVPMKEEIYAACFIEDDTVLIAANNVIYLWLLKQYQQFKTFYGHEKKIIRLEVHPNGRSFLSCSEDGTVKLWSLPPPWNPNWAKEGRQKSASENFKSSSPSSLQKNWNSSFLDDIPRDESMKTLEVHSGPVLDARFSHSGEAIISCSENSVIVWNHERNTRKVTENTVTGNGFIRCIFSMDGSHVFIGRMDATLSVHDAKTLDFLASFRNVANIVDIFSVQYEKNKVLVVSQKDLRIWHWECPDSSVPVVSDNPTSPVYAVGQISYYSLVEKEGDAVYMCATMSGDSIVIVAASDYVISVWDLKRKVLISEHHNPTGPFRCLDTYVSCTISLLMCGEDRTVKIWHLAQVGTECALKLSADFHAVWDSANPSALPLIATSNSENALQVLHGGSLLAEASAEQSKIMTCAVSSSLSAVFYGCADGQVKKFNIADKCCRVIMKFNEAVRYLESLNYGKEILVAGDGKNLKLWKEDNSVVMCYGQTSPVIRCFLIPGTDLLLACNQDAGVKLWNVSSGILNQVIIGYPKGMEILSADLSSKAETLVLVDKSSTIQMASLVLNSDGQNLAVSSLLKIQTDLEPVLSCKISPGGQILALGFENGKIQIWDLHSRQLLKEELDLHKSPVSDLHFISPLRENHFEEFFVLISVGEKIAWWKIYHSSNNVCSSLSRLNPFESERENVDSPTGLKAWANKKGNVEKPLLLGCIKLVGPGALKICYSSDFSQFVTIDTSGILYLLKTI